MLDNMQLIGVMFQAIGGIAMFILAWRTYTLNQTIATDNLNVARQNANIAKDNLGITRQSHTLAKVTAYVDTITSERIKWVEKLRNNVSDMLSYIDSHQTVTSKRARRLAIKLAFEIRLQLNLTELNDRFLDDLITQNIVLNENINLSREIVGDIINATQAVLKKDWERAKQEAVQGDISKEYQHQREQEKAESEQAVKQIKEWTK